MKNQDDCCFDRRRVLLGGMTAIGALALAPSARGAVRLLVPLGAQKEGAQRTLVLLQLSGGNDGLSTVVPYGDDVYARSRSSTRIAEKDVLKIDGYRGLHPALKSLKSVFDDGRLAIVEGCGYPSPIRSHFKSMEIWHSASARGRAAGVGWVGRLCEAAWGKDATAELVVHVGANEPFSLYSTRHPAVSFQTPASYKWVASRREDMDAYRRSGEARDDEGGVKKGDEKKEDGKAVLDRLRGVLNDAQESSTKVRRAYASYRPKKAYPDDELGQSLQVAAALLDAHVGSRVISVELGGFDSHNNQRNQHDDRMRRLDTALSAFLEDVKGTSAGDETVVVAFSEFGRRVKENGSGGTDHGVAGPMLVAGTSVKGGLYGKHPSMTDLADGDLVHTTDFRSVYGTVVERWFGVDHAKVLDAKYPLLPLLRA